MMDHADYADNYPAEDMTREDYAEAAAEIRADMDREDAMVARWEAERAAALREMDADLTWEQEYRVSDDDLALQFGGVEI